MTSSPTHNPTVHCSASVKTSPACMNLPVAPRANARIRFASDTKANAAISPMAAVTALEQLISDGKKIDCVSIAGPGDPLTVFDATYTALALVKAKFPEMALSISTVGFGGAYYVDKLAELKISHITVLVDAVDSGIAAELYSWIRPSTKTVPLAEASKILVEEQAGAIKAFKKAGLTVNISTTVYPANAGHIEEIAKTVKEYGADIMSISPFVPEEGSSFSAASDEQIESARVLAAKHIELMEPWETCGAEVEVPPSSTLPRPTRERPNVAVASTAGMDIDLHLGQAHQLLIYGRREDGLACLLETRPAPEPGGGNSRWESLADTLSDCFVLLTSSAGENPKQILESKGLRVIISEENVEGTVDVLYGGGKKGKKCKN
ncbi:NifB/NifX family molybdenum-iron cluster-binding protein [Maridesulfovibrio sp.]|uniref:NifB/NifX family molybdenum-iron cluster-binding protein n=1 Tax=Maridesulfovibrio sp. TaxID=2795000 RepID=UPI002A18E1EC|nr:NifB/NifX family molybdenum-iron cluster-binding protein [Maridesulfovibrio sp.]